MGLIFINNSMYSSSLQTLPFYIFMGCSNCGRSRTVSLSANNLTYAGPQNNCYIFNSKIDTSGFYPLNVGYNTLLLNATSPDEFGAEASLMKSLSIYKNKKIYLLKEGIGGTYLEGTNQWLPTGNSTMYQKFINNIRGAVDNAKRNGIILELKGFIQMLGENDATDQIKSNNYLANLGTFFTQFDTDYNIIINSFGLPTLNYKKIIGRINGINDVSEVYRTTVRQAQADFCAIGANNSILIDTDAYPFLDNVHYTADSNITFGLTIFSQIKNF